RKFAAHERSAVPDRAWLVYCAFRGRLDESMEMAARDSNGHLVPRVHDRDFRRNKPAAIRFAGSRAGARRRLQHRIQLNEVRALFCRRIRRDDHRVCCCRDVIFWWLAFSGDTRWLPRMDLRPDQHRSLFRKSRRRHFPVYVGALDAPTISLGSTDEAGLAFLFRNRVGEHFLPRCNSSFQFKIMNLETKKPRRRQESVILNSWIPAFQIKDQ